MKQTPTQIATKIVDTAAELGWKLTVRGSILTIDSWFPAGDKEAFVRRDGEYYSILGLLPTTSAGSTWGTDGGGIGALSAIKSGHFRMNKSGGAKRVLSALAKMPGVS